MSETPAPARRLAIGPSGDGLWIVQDENGVCGAVFSSREEAVSFARAECGTAGAWRWVEALDMGAMFGRAG